VTDDRLALPTGGTMPQHSCHWSTRDATAAARGSSDVIEPGDKFTVQTTTRSALRPSVRSSPPSIYDDIHLLSQDHKLLLQPTAAPASPLRYVSWSSNFRQLWLHRTKVYLW